MMEIRKGNYLKINGTQYDKIFVVGDIHGCYQLLMNKLQQVDFDYENDLLISVGDIIDRGDRNVECLDLITQKWFRAVRGNHEQMAIDTLFNDSDGYMWFSNGGEWFLNLDYEQYILAKVLLAKAEQLPLVIEVNTAGKKIVISHADYPDNEYEFGKDVNWLDVIWNRERVDNGVCHEIEGADLFIFGHTPVSKPMKICNQEYIDTGAVFGNELTIKQIQ
ncbi:MULTISPECIES: metallophosphoesterase [Photorhabdus]|uniref:Serine/threonine-protein phosphatase n=1 Tax=Photorhabdus luminescens subsp. sonorensis TaxID=1173677 RepID=A0A5C4RIC3_PHOLU|nr:metallophosphoesterase [Photorhabdus luminescens]TNH43773.1 serine/threonine-protein phosphatase [Photorhabdus luminescens subsp. sonorensis]